MAVMSILWRRYPLLSLCVLLGLATALSVLARRFALERSFRSSVEITIDGDDWTTLARRHGMDREMLYDELYRHGVRSVSLYAASLHHLSDMGLLTYMTGTDALDAARAGALGGSLADLARTGRLRPNDTYVLAAPATMQLVRDGFRVQIGADRVAVLKGSGPVLDIMGRGRDLEDASLGIVPSEVDAAERHHLAVELRVRNVHDMDTDRLDAFFASLRRSGEDLTLIFDQDQVLGYDQLIPDVAAEMKQSRFAFGEIEAQTARRQQKGEAELGRRMAPDVIRVFSLTPQELANSTPDEARDKYVLAARERNVRILYVRPFLNTSAGVNALNLNMDYVAAIAADLTHAGYKLNKAAPLTPLTTPAALVGLMALGALAATAVATGEVGDAVGLRVPAPWLGSGVVAGTAVTLVLLAAHHPTPLRQALAFLAALAFPTLAMLWIVPGARRPVEGTSRLNRETWPAGRLVLWSIAGLWRVSAVTALGGILVAALLSEWQFMMMIREFVGVKLAHVIPVVVIGLCVAAAGSSPGTLWARLRAWLRQPLLLEYGILIIFVGMAAVFALGRTGNSGLPLLGSLELKSRILLQRTLIARPRTKEYLVGDPFMVLAFALAALGAYRWVLPAVMIGAIGQVGLINSFSHIHTPLMYIFARTLYALVIGSVLGAVLVGLLCWSRRYWDAGRARAGTAPPAPGMPPMA
jgi:Family of unknown function (DUF5693)